MNTKFFGQFLLEKRIINRDQLLQGLDEQRKSSPLLGDIAVEKGFIDLKQAEKINQEQKKQDKRFGAIAIELGLLDESKIEELLAEQQKNKKYFGEILVELGIFSAEVLDTQLAAHKADTVDMNEQISDCFHNCKIPKQSILVSDTFTRFYQRMVKMLLSTANVMVEQTTNENDLYIWSQAIETGKKYRLVLAMNSEHACAIATSFVGIEVTEMDELAIDAVGEFLNTFTGHVYSKLDEDAKPNVSPPEYHQQKMNVALSPCTTMQFDSGQYLIEVSLGIEA